MGAFNGSGVFVRSYSWVNDAANGIDITASRVDTEDTGFASGLSLCVTRDGQGQMLTDFVPAVDGNYSLGTAAFRWLNGQFAGNLAFGGRLISATQPSFNAQTATSSVNIPASTVSTVVFNHTNTDIGTHYNTGTGIYTAAVAGVYRFDANVILQNNASGSALVTGVYFSLNNNAINTLGAAFNLGGFTNGGSINAGSNSFNVSGGVTLQMAQGDTMRVNISMGTIGGIGTFSYNVPSSFSGGLLFASS